MAEVASGIPHWLQMVWAISGSTALILAVFWTLFIFYPYLRRMERKQDRALEIGEQTSKILDDVQERLNPMIDKIEKAVELIPDITKDVAKVVHEVREAIDEVKKKGDLEKVSHMVSKLNKILDGLESGKSDGVPGVLKGILDIRHALVGDFEKISKFVKGE